MVVSPRLPFRWSLPLAPFPGRKPARFSVRNSNLIKVRFSVGDRGSSGLLLCRPWIQLQE